MPSVDAGRGGRCNVDDDMGSSTVIFIHGVGDCGVLWERKLEKIFAGKKIKIFCPTAPKVPVSVFGGCVMTSWFDMAFGDWGCFLTRNDLNKAAKFVHNLIELEIKSGTEPSRIVLAGHSQGGALALASALTFKSSLGGVCCFGGWLPHSYVADGGIGKKKTVLDNVLVCHGENDERVPLEQGRRSIDFLKKRAKNLEFKTSKGSGHGIGEPQLMEFLHFCSGVLKV